MTLGQHIQELRKSAGLSQEMLGEHLGVSRQAVSKWESDVTIPEVDTLIAMSRLFGVTVGQLLQVEETAGSVNEELTDRELAAIETIVRRYVEEMESRRPKTPPPSKPRRWPLVLCAVCGVLAIFWLVNFLDSMNSTISRLQSELNRVNSNVSSQISNITSQVTDLLEEQSSILLDESVQISLIDIETNTFTLDMWAIPKVWQEGMTVTFVVDCGGEVFTLPGTETDGHRFTGSLSCPLGNGAVQVDASFTVDGVTQTQRMTWMSHYLLEDTFPWVNIIGSLPTVYSGALSANGDLVIREGDLFVDVHTFGAEEQFQGVTFAGPAPTLTDIKAGLFLNKTLVTWFTPMEGSLSGVVPEQYDWLVSFSNPAMTIQLEEGDELALAVVVTDSYGRTRLMLADAPLLFSGGELAAAASYDTVQSIDEWTF